MCSLALTLADKATPSGSAKKARNTAPVKPQSNTLYSWFKKTAAPKPNAPTPASSSNAMPIVADSDTGSKSCTSENDSNGEGVAASADAVPTRASGMPPAKEKKTVVDAGASSTKKLVQRRIHINDPCRVCDSARTEDTSRCELRCLECDMTVHKVRALACGWMGG